MTRPSRSPPRWRARSHPGPSGGAAKSMSESCGGPLYKAVLKTGSDHTGVVDRLLDVLKKGSS